MLSMIWAVNHKKTTIFSHRSQSPAFRPQSEKVELGFGGRRLLRFSLYATDGDAALIRGKTGAGKNTI